VRIEPRISTLPAAPVVVPLGSLLAAGLFGALLLAVSGHQPLQIYAEIAAAGFLAPGALQATLISSAPLLLASLAAAAAFRIRLWNIGGEGQLYLGSVGALGVALLMGHRLGVLVVPAMMLAGAAAGAAWALVPALLRAFLHTNEIITTLMLNYLAGLLIAYLIYDSGSFWRDLSSTSARVFPTGKHLEGPAVWPVVEIPGTGVAVPLGFLAGIFLALLVWLLFRSTTAGFQARVVGDSPAAATYAGISVRRAVITVMCLSGALAGLAGASDSGDFRHALDPAGMQASGFGYAGIVVAALARYNSLAVVPVALLVGGLYSASYSVSGSVLPSGLVGVLQGVILFFVVAGEAVAGYRLAWGRRLAPVRMGATEDAPAETA
jgi:general nucleoside transport system permease protein